MRLLLRRAVHKVLGVELLAEHSFALRLERNGVQFIPGQCFNLGLPSAAVNREYSSYSGVGEQELHFLIREVEGGEVSPRLKALRPGDEVEVDGAYGQFTLDTTKIATHLFYFIATGTGIAPFHCFVKSYPNLEYRIVHGTRSNLEAYNRKDYPADRYINCTSRDASGDFHGRVTEYLLAHPPARGAIYYLCGNRNMINDVYDILRDRDISSSHIITEVFF
jgi:ferredoxin-NADP reductase